MARSPALRETLVVAAAAAAGWLALVAALFQFFPVAPPRAARPLRALAAHRPVTAPIWHGAPQVYDEIERRARGLSRDQRLRTARAILEESARAELAPLLVLAVIHVESRFDPRAVSPVGAVGLMQLMTPTFRAELAATGPADPFDPVANVRAGVRYLARLVNMFSDVELALVAYNAGPGAVRRHLDAGGVPDRLRAYPRDVLREAVRLWPASHAAADPRGDAGPARLALGAAHRLSPAALPPALALSTGSSGAGPRAAPPPATVAALEPGAACAGAEALASARLVGSREEVLAAPIRSAPALEACAGAEIGIPMRRERAAGWSPERVEG